MTASKIILYHDEVARQAEIKQFIDENFREELTIKILSKKFTISKSTLERHFRFCYKESVTRYIQRCRMLRAMDLVTEHSIPISQVGMTVGYNDRSAFTHAFTKFFGNAPAFFLRNSVENAELNQLTT